MRSVNHSLTAFLVGGGAMLALTAPLGVSQHVLQSNLPRVVIETELGDIEIVVDTVSAPNTAANFLRYVAGGHYTGGRFYRTVTKLNQPADSVRIEVIQGGANPDRRGERFPAIALERASVTGCTTWTALSRWPGPGRTPPDPSFSSVSGTNRNSISGVGVTRTARALPLLAAS